MQRVNDILTNIIQSTFKKTVTYEKVTKHKSGAAMTDLLVDNLFYTKKGTEYFKLVHHEHINLRMFGGNGDDVYVVFDAACTGGTKIITSATGNFTADLVGQYAMIRGGGPGGIALVSTITNVDSPTQIRISATINSSASATELTYGGTDSTSIFNQAITYLKANGGGKLYIPVGRYWVNGTIYIDPSDQIPIEISGATCGVLQDGWGTRSNSTAILRGVAGDIIRVNLDSSGNKILAADKQYTGFAISNINFISKCDLSGIRALNVFRTRGKYVNLSASKLDYLVYQAPTDGTGTSNYCDMSLYKDICINASLLGGMLLDHADCSRVDGFFYEGSLSGAKYGLQIESSRGVHITTVLNGVGVGGTVVTDGGLVQLKNSLGTVIDSIYSEDCELASILYVQNCYSTVVNALVNEIVNRDTIRVDTVRGLEIRNWTSYDTKPAGCYDLNILSGVNSNEDIIPCNWNFYETTDVIGAVRRDPVINNSIYQGKIIRQVVKDINVTNLNNVFAWKWILSSINPTNAPNSVQYFNGFQVEWNNDSNFQSQFGFASTKLAHRSKFAGTWASWRFINSKMWQTASDADFTGSQWGATLYLGAITANRTFPFPASELEAGISFTVINRNTSAFAWTSSATYVNPSGQTTNECPNGSVMIFERDHLGFWRLMNIYKTRKSFSITKSGDGVSSTVSIAHGLPTTPSFFSVRPMNAASKNIAWYDKDATNITLHYDAPLASGTNNLSYDVTVEA